LAEEELSGTTLLVYLYVVKEAKPVGPREAMKGVRLSSPSVAYRHLQKLEEMGLVQKNEYGDYIVKKKASKKGYVWVGRRMLSAMFVYALAFMGVLLVEATVLAMHYNVETYEFKVFFLLLMLVTASAMCIFTLEGIRQSIRLKRAQAETNSNRRE
jgi:repressor of nif and glnA expression